MRNPYVIQYLESLYREDGSVLCQPAAIQVLLPSVPPFTQLPFTIKPVPGYYASIGYGSSVDLNVIPNAWMLNIVQFGAQPFIGVLSSDMITYGVEYIATSLTAQPIYITLTNLTPLNQYLCITVFFVTITDEDGFAQAKDRLSKLGTVEAVDLLKRLTNAPLMPKGGE